MDHQEINRQFVIEGLILTIIGAIGILGNIGAVTHFGKAKYRQHRFYLLMLTLAIVDILLIISFIWFFSVPAFSGKNRHTYRWSIWLYPTLHIFSTGNVFLTVAISLDRYLAICKPLSYHSSPYTTRKIFFLIAFLSISYNIPRFFELEWLVFSEKRNGSVINFEFGAWPTELQMDKNYSEIYGLWLNIIILGVAPMFILIGLNVSIFKEMRRFKQYVLGGDKHDERWRASQLKLAKINFIILIIFSFCHPIKHILSAHELYYRYNLGINVKKWPHKQTRYVMSEISHVMIVLNSCVNFYVYLFKKYLNSNINYIQCIDKLHLDMIFVGFLFNLI